MNETFIFTMINKFIADQEEIERQNLQVDDVIFFTGHALQRMEERNITINEVMNILKNPKYIRKESESSHYAGKDNYRIMDQNDNHSVVISIHFDRGIFIITVID